MMGVSSFSNLSFWLTKNDFWCLACGQEPECRYGDFNQTLYVPPMEIKTHCGTAQSLDRNSQATAGVVTIQPDFNAPEFKFAEEGWSAEQRMENSTVLGRFELASNGTAGEVR